MLEKLFEYTPEELGHILSIETMGLIEQGTYQEDQGEEAVEAAFLLVASELSTTPLTEEELADAVDKIKLYVQTNGIQEN